MSSNPPADLDSTIEPSGGGEREAARRRWSLRARLLVGQVVLLVVVVAGIGIATEIALQRFLVHQVDVSLGETAKRALVDSGGGPSLGPRPPDQHNPAGQSSAPGQNSGFGQNSAPAPPPPAPKDGYGSGPDFLNRRSIQPDTIGALVESDGSVSAARVHSDGTQSLLSESARGQLAAVATGKPVTLDIPGEGHYRVQAETTWSGRTVVTALPLASVEATMMRVFLILVIVTASVLVSAISVGIWLIRRALAPLDRVAATATRVADLRLDRGEVTLPVRVPAADADPRTEVGQLGAAVNRMLDHIASALSARHASETRIRRFLADASHELRTPLAVVRGYAELAQRERDSVPEAIAHAMSRIDSESRRMTTLVEDMLLLARLDAGRGLEQTPVDLTRLTVDAVSDAHIAGPDLKWRLELPAEPIMIEGDSARLHQVLANLLANARTHTGPGTTVTTALAEDGRGGARWRVTDDGPGIPADLQPEVFQRFARGDSSRSRRVGSTGLGLAIVAAVVKAHGGDITVESAPGRTEFTVDLPATH
ncbi:sensor histidine kinase [Nocardia seriolae]|uniref:histidine kinase n=1 Tax=Nocardia seriolae TaxID=37332 RepID=A0ABC9Z612_9NOCA|nr:HAMP domain-containing sensor histidine kinase [Nocardia seriolae]OJF79992.1 two-component sensor histidine kinase [Nocardia seriolae]PSK28966.1 sensor histidine kinase [Nocardia seriolae]QOW36073.1 HAMP domain-containing histidine kinase [Nocardia seriolae]QUN16431.1 HAMP domain-containing histidine kinase [Nocardia seriolae]WNJ56510.1 HAMP domain-containing sensor histidine kinase [Nocardia seriolae]